MDSPNTSTRILAIETSCDETAAAVIADGTKILSNVVASQTDLHARYGGVFPEVASRQHVEVIHAVVEEAMRLAHLGFDDLDCVAVTRGPGLVGSLLVGMNMAKGLAVSRNLPLMGINHIEGHIYSLWLTDETPNIRFPLITLVVSGGHTDLYLMTDHGRYRLLGATLDDAAGEAFDKVGRLLGLPYPGGPAIDKASEHGSATTFRFPRALMDKSTESTHGYDFSFSGLKTAVMRQTSQYHSTDAMPVADLAAGFQAAVVESLVEKTAAAAEEFEVTAVHIAGGVSANRALRAAMRARLDIPVRFPPMALCTDNAAMIGAAAHFHFIKGRRDSLDLDVTPNLQLV
jgi:N6-L-threonylcarbamoyladenine synthase